MEVIADVKKIINQILGRENMFYFQTTLANQLYLIYCFTGNIYFTDRINRKTKFLWFCWSQSGLLVMALSVILFPIYCDRTKDILVLIYVGFAVVIIMVVCVIRPVIAVLRYKTDIEQMILMADKIISKSPTNESQSSSQLYMRKIILNIIIALWSSLIPYLLITIMDMALFYEKEKIEDNMYYIIPLCGIERFGSLTLYIFYNIATSMAGIPFFIMMTMYSLLPVLWVVICYEEAQRIIGELNLLSSEEIDINTFESRFTNTIKKCVHDINDLTKMISYFRGYLETTAGILMPTLLYVEIIHALVMVTPGYSYMVRTRELSALLGTIVEVYIMCWVGAKLEDMTTNLSFAVYCTPWYLMTSVRKNVYILLCQTQSPIEPKALSVYPLNLATFMRFCNTINSSVNVFRAYISK